jgi:hypothetical protein
MYLLLKDAATINIGILCKTAETEIQLRNQVIQIPTENMRNKKA